MKDLGDTLLDGRTWSEPSGDGSAGGSTRAGEFGGQARIQPPSVIGGKLLCWIAGER